MTKVLKDLPFIGALNEAFAGLRRAFSDSYRPELHYMRGPGPKARAKRAV